LLRYALHAQAETRGPLKVASLARISGKQVRDEIP